jgi:hypothetical protein
MASTLARTGGDYLSKVAKHDRGARISKTASPPDVGVEVLFESADVSGVPIRPRSSGRETEG